MGTKKEEVYSIDIKGYLDNYKAKSLIIRDDKEYYIVPNND